MLFIIYEYVIFIVIFYRSILCKIFEKFNINSDYKEEFLINYFFEIFGIFIVVLYKFWIMNILFCYWGFVIFL